MNTNPEQTQREEIPVSSPSASDAECMTLWNGKWLTLDQVSEELTAVSEPSKKDIFIEEYISACLDNYPEMNREHAKYDAEYAWNTRFGGA